MQFNITPLVFDSESRLFVVTSDRWSSLAQIYATLGDLASGNSGFHHQPQPNFTPSISQFLATVCTQSSPIAVTEHLQSYTVPPTIAPADLALRHHASQDSLSRSSLACARVAGRAPKDTRT
jgi:hypothetical protein